QVQIRRPTVSGSQGSSSGKRSFVRKGTQFVHKQDLPAMDAMVHFQDEKDDEVEVTKDADTSGDGKNGKNGEKNATTLSSRKPRVTLQRQGTAFARFTPGKMNKGDKKQDGSTN
ncbi:unnamed protein product, partial [Amoebophrya sp. A120]